LNKTENKQREKIENKQEDKNNSWQKRKIKKEVPRNCSLKITKMLKTIERNPMTKLGQKTEKSKTFDEVLKSDTITKLALLKNQYEISMMLIQEILEDEIRHYAGDRYSHDKPHGGRYSRWGNNPGSVWVGEEKVKIDVPRLYDNESETNKSLSNYEKLKEINSEK
jgi:hypothetical protein